MKNSRPPIVVVLGHVDHGKTSLLDALRKTSVAAREAGGITQSIGASVIETPDHKKITFIDTPGHAAFSKMRSRGAKVADIAILVVASEDGIKPQTLEALTAIKEAKIPFLVALTKVDLPSSDPERALAQLEKEEVFFEGRGGTVPYIEVSSKTGKGLDDLLQTLVLLGEVSEISADENADLEAIVIETQKDKRGPLASVVVRNGKVVVGESVSSDTVSAKIRGIFDSNGKSTKTLLPGEPGILLGFSDLPLVGSKLVKGEVKFASPVIKSQNNTSKGSVSIYIKTNNAGSLEALVASLPSGIKLIASSVGDVNESDIFLAKASGAWIFVFEAKVPSNVARLSETEGVRIEKFGVIYELIKRLEELLQKGQVEVLGKANVLGTFPFNNRKVAGCKVVEGRINKADTVVILRNDKEIGKSKISSMRRGKQEIGEAKAGEEFGAILDTSLDFQIGDVILATK